MINVIIGAKGSGKTKYMVDHVNMAVKDEPGTLVFVSKDNRLMLDLKSAVRYINTEEFAVDDYNVLYGFLGGIISNNYDVSHIFIDSIWKVVSTAEAGFEGFLNKIEALGEKLNINFTITISADREAAPEYLKKYLVEI